MRRFHFASLLSLPFCLLVFVAATFSTAARAQAYVDNPKLIVLVIIDQFRGDYLNRDHQLFKGNEYAFWLGTANEDCELELAVFDSKGQPVHMERKTGKFTCSVRVNPPATGTYTVVFSVKSKKERGVTWALAYGYR